MWQCSAWDVKQMLLFLTQVLVKVLLLMFPTPFYLSPSAPLLAAVAICWLFRLPYLGWKCSLLQSKPRVLISASLYYMCLIFRFGAFSRKIQVDKVSEKSLHACDKHIQIPSNLVKFFFLYAKCYKNMIKFVHAIVPLDHKSLVWVKEWVCFFSLVIFYYHPEY